MISEEVGYYVKMLYFFWGLLVLDVFILVDFIKFLEVIVGKVNDVLFWL